jgi:hypothetical protein
MPIRIEYFSCRQNLHEFKGVIKIQLFIYWHAIVAILQCQICNWELMRLPERKHLI